MDITKKRLGDMLVSAGKITQAQLENVLKKQKSSGKRIGEILVEDRIVTEEDIMNTLEVQLAIPRVHIEMFNVDYEAVRSIPETLAQKYTLIPIAISDNRLSVVMSDPLNIFALDDVKIASGYDVEPMIATRDEIKRAIDRYYSGQFLERAAAELSRENIARIETEEDDSSIDDIKNAPAVKLVDSIIRNAIKARASDIHIEPFEKYIKVRFRVDGDLHETIRAPRETLPSLVTRIKILSNLNIAEKRIPQDGRILTRVEDKEVDLRVSILPTVHGEKIVIRILGRDSFLVNKQKLGMLEDDLEKLERIIKSPYGIILVTGPTGSGKSTTLYTILRELNTVDKNIITVEDPVEYMMEGISQVNVNVKAGLTFAAGLRSILRQDPDIIMIGEIRDNETAEIAIRAAITGHLVLSTIHTNDAPSAALRLTDMGVEPYLVATSIAGIISQRLVRKICPNCGTAYEADTHEKMALGIPQHEHVILHRGKGCGYCGNSGYVGRVGVYEIMEIGRNQRQYIMDGKSTDEIRDLCMEEGMKTLNLSCRRLVLNGTTTIDELVKIAYLKD